MIVPLSPLAFKQRATQLYGRKIGVVDGERRFTYAEFGERTNRLANAILDAGVRPGDRVGFLAYNSYPLLEGYYGILAAGAILMPINIRLSPDDIAYILEDSGARLLFVDRDFAPMWASIRACLATPPRVVWLSGTPEEGGLLYDDLLAAASPDTPPPFDVDENDVAEIFYTSGTTGRPKGVMLTHRNLYLHALQAIIVTEAREHDVQLHTIPLFHVNGWGTPQSLTAVGGRHIMMRRFEPATTLQLIETERVTRFFAVPTMLAMLLNHQEVTKRDLSSLTLVMTGGAPTPPEMVRQAERMLGCRVIAGYGLSETSPIITLATDKSYLTGSEDERFRRQASTGLPVVGVDLRIVDAKGQDVPWNGRDAGEIVVRSNVVMSGYWNDPEATASTLRDGWFHTGDVAVVDPEGYVLIVDRTKDMIVCGGENISSVEIEKILFEHPAVLESAVVAAPDERWGEIPVAVVALKDGCEASEAELIDFCRERLAGFKVPKRVEFRPSLPKGGTGKILKRELREPYWQGSPKRVH